MAITMRHGPYNKFDPQKLRTGEIAAVTEGDPHASDGKAIYQCFSPGDVKRMAKIKLFNLRRRNRRKEGRWKQLFHPALVQQ